MSTIKKRRNGGRPTIVETTKRKKVSSKESKKNGRIVVVPSATVSPPVSADFDDSSSIQHDILSHTLSPNVSVGVRPPYGAPKVASDLLLLAATADSNDDGVHEQKRVIVHHKVNTPRYFVHVSISFDLIALWCCCIERNQLIHSPIILPNGMVRGSVMLS